MIAVDIRPYSGHRMAQEPGADERCLGCGWDGLGMLQECRPGMPRCEKCGGPADILDTIGGELFQHCAGCRNGIRVAMG